RRRVRVGRWAGRRLALAAARPRRVPARGRRAGGRSLSVRLGAASAAPRPAVHVSAVRGARLRPGEPRRSWRCGLGPLAGVARVLRAGHADLRAAAWPGLVERAATDRPVPRARTGPAHAVARAG